MFKGCPTKNGDLGEKRIGYGSCFACDGRVFVKMNKAGWPYYRCECGHHPQIRGKLAAEKILLSVTHWHKNAKVFINKVYADLGLPPLLDLRLKNEPEPIPELKPEPEPDLKPVRKKTRIGMM